MDEIEKLREALRSDDSSHNLLEYQKKYKEMPELALNKAAQKQLDQPSPTTVKSLEAQLMFSRRYMKEFEDFLKENNLLQYMNIDGDIKEHSALYSARKFIEKQLDQAPLIDELLAAREKATEGEWGFLFGQDVGVETSFVQRVGGLGMADVICRIKNAVSKKPLTEEDRANGDFIATAANTATELIALRGK